MGTSLRVPGKIAGFVDEAGTLSDLFGPGVVRIFDRRSGAWAADRDIPFTLAETGSLGQMRSQLQVLADKLGDCQVLLLGEVRGVLPALLAERGIAVSQIAGNALECLARVLVEEGPAEPVAPQDPPPVEAIPVDTGVFRLDLAAARREHPRLTSRQILIPLLTQGGFTLLEVLCDHPPRWLDSDGRKLGYGYEASPCQDPKDGFIVTLFPDAEACATAGGSCGVVLGAGGCSSGCGSRYGDEPMDL